MRKLIMIAAAAALALALAAAPALARNFTADMKITGAVNQQASIAAQDGKMALDMASPQGPTLMIINSEADKYYVCMKAMKTCMKMPQPPESVRQRMLQTIDDVPDKYKKKLGSETVAGIDCDVYEITDPELGGKAKIWYSPKLNFPVKMVSETPQGPMTQTLSNIKEGAAKAEMFDKPAGWQEMDVPPGMAEAMGKGMQRQ